MLDSERPVSFGTSTLAAPVTYGSAAPVTYAAGTYATTYAPPTYGASPYQSYINNFGTGPFVFTADPAAEEARKADAAKDEDITCPVWAFSRLES